MDHTNEVVARVAMLATKAAAIYEEFESVLGPVMKPPVPAVPPPAPNMTEEVQPGVYAPIPPLFANLHEQMDVLEDRLLQMVSLRGRVEL